jgi:transposase
MDLPDARSLSPESLEVLRRLAVRAVVELNMSQKEVAAVFGVGENAVGKWCRAYREEGLNVQPQGRPLGTGRSLTPSEEKELQAISSSTHDSRTRLLSATRFGLTTCSTRYVR